MNQKGKVGAAWSIHFSKKLRFQDMFMFMKFSIPFVILDHIIARDSGSSISICESDP